MTDSGKLDLSPTERAALQRADEHPEHLTAHDQSILGELIDRGGEARQVAVRALLPAVGSDIDWQSVALASPLAAALDDGTDTVRKHASKILGGVGAADPAAMTGDGCNALIDALADEWDAVRRNAVRALGRLGAADPDAVANQMGFLVEALDDEAPRVRKAAAETLGRVGCASSERAADAIGPLVAALDDEEPAVRWTTAEQVGHVVASTPELTADAVGPLAATLADRAANVRRVSAVALGRIGAGAPDRVSGAVGPLAAALDDEEPRVRSGAAAALGRIGAESPDRVTDAVDPLIAALDDGSPVVRKEAAAALGRIGEAAPELVADTVSPLVVVVHDEYADARAAAATALGQVGPTGTVDEILAAFEGLFGALSDGHEATRQAAATALGRFVAGTRGNEDIEEAMDRLEDRLNGRATDLLAERLDDHCTNVAVAAAFAVFRAGVIGHELRATARDRLREGLTEYEWPLLTSRLVAELAANGPVVHPMMREMFYDDEADGDPAVRDLVPDLVQLFDYPDSNVRRHACRALGHLDATAAAADLERVAAEDERATVRKAAAAALDRIGTTVAAGDKTDDSETPSEPGAAPVDPAEPDETTAGAAADTTPSPAGEGGTDSVPADEPGEPAGSLADRAALYARLLEYARTESLHECRRWAEELHRFVEATPVDDEGYAVAHEEAATLVEERLPNEREVFGDDHGLVTGDRPLAKVAPELHEAIGDVAFTVRRCYVRGE